MKAIIFGAAGQDGHYLQKILEREGVTVHAFNSKECDVGVQGIVCHQIAQLQPDYIFHLAAASTTAHAAIWENKRAIVDGSLYILDAVQRFAPKAKVFLSGSILQFTYQQSVNINNRPANDSIYAAQRNASVAYARYYRRLGVQVYVGYFSHHDSPLRSAKHLAKRIAIETGEAARGLRDKVIIKDPLDEKEWNFAGDMMEAVWDQVNGPCYEAVLGSGIKHTIADYARECIKAWDDRLIAGAIIWQEFTREGATVSCTADMRFEKHFKTTLPELAKIMIA